MTLKLAGLCSALLLVLTACTPAEPTPTLTPVPTYTPAATNTPTSAFGKWQNSPSSERDSILLGAEEGVNWEGKRYALVIRCWPIRAKGNLELYIWWGYEFGDDMKKVPVEYQIGSYPSRIIAWDTYRSGIYYPAGYSEYTYYPGGYLPVVRFIDAMLGETQLLVKVTPENQNPMTAIFDITGIEQAYSGLGYGGDSCSFNW